MSSQLQAAAPLTAEQLHKLAETKAMAEARKAFEQSRKADEERRQMREAFMGREVRPDGMDKLMAVVRNMAEQGHREVLVLQFPSDYLSDGGRAVNNFEPDWPKTLQGFARRALDFYEEHLKPHGYKLRAEILNYPDGNLGDVGLFLSW